MPETSTSESTATSPEEVTARDASLPGPPDPYFYNCTRVPAPLADTLVWGLSEARRMISGDQLPPAPPDDAGVDELHRWWAELHAALTRLGVVGAYRAHMAGRVLAVACPWWCTGDHPMLVDGEVGQVHTSLPAGGVEFSVKPELHPSSSWTLVVSQWEGPMGIDGGEVGPVCLEHRGELLPEQLDLEDARCVAQALQRGLDWLEHVVSTTAAAAQTVEATA